MQSTRNLLIVHAPGKQAVEDWRTVKATISERAPDIDVRVAENENLGPITRRWQVSRPSLVFAPAGVPTTRIRGGTVYAGKSLPKLDQIRRMESHGVPTPRTLALMPGLALREDAWGDYVIVKPSLGSLGIGVRLVSREELPRRYPSLINAKGADGRMLVQRFIDHTDADGHLVDYRALMMFGTPLYLHRRRWSTPRRPLADLARELSNEIASNARSSNRERDLVAEPAVLAFAETISAVFPEIPLLGIDIVRERSTGVLHALEVNPSGNTWHFSSDIGRHQFSEELRQASYRQFNALDTAADLLIERTRAAAS